MNCVIIEDELAGQELLKIKLTRFFPEIQIVRIIDNKTEAVKFLNENPYGVDFIFLDIQIKEGTGLQVLQEVENRHFEVIFTTAYDQYTLDAFQQEATHYLLKPIQDSELKTAVERLLKKKNNNRGNETIIIPNKNSFFSLKINEILYFKSDGSYTEIFTSDKKLISSKNIGYFEKLLDKNHFFRVHHSYLVNKAHIVEVQKGRGGNVILTGNIQIPVSQRRMQDFMHQFK